MPYGSLVDKGGGEQTELYLNDCHGRFNICPIFEFSHQNCQQNLLKQLYGYNSKNTCCLMRRSNSATVSIANVVPVKKLPKNVNVVKNSQDKNTTTSSDSAVLESESEDSDAEFAVHECLRDLIKSRSVQAFQTKTKMLGKTNLRKPSLDSQADSEMALDPKSLSINDTLTNTDTIDEPGTTGLEARVLNGETEKKNIKQDSVTCWSAPDCLTTNENNDSDDEERISEANSPKDYCWSAPELACDDMYDSCDEDVGHQKGSFTNRDRLCSLPSSIFSDYDEPKRPSFLALDGQESDRFLNNAKRVLQFPKTLALEESYNSMDIYVASPSPQREMSEKEVYQSFHEKKSTSNFASPSGIDFIDSPDENNDIPFGYEHFVVKIAAIQRKVTTDENRNSCYQENTTTDECYSEYCRNCMAHPRDGETQECSIDDIEILEQKEPENETERFNEESENAEDVLKRFMGFKAFDIQTTKEISRDNSSKYDKVGKAVMNTESEEQFMSYTLPNSPYEVSNTQLDCGKSSPHQSHSEVYQKPKDIEQINNIKTLALSTKMEQNITNSGYKDRQVICNTQMRRSVTDCKLNYGQSMANKVEQGQTVNPAIIDNRHIALKKSQTLIDLNKVMENTEVYASGRRRLPAAPNQENDNIQLSNVNRRDSFISINAMDKGQYDSNRTFLNKTAIHQQTSRLHNGTGLTDWTPTEEFRKSIAKNPTPYMDLDFSKNSSPNQPYSGGLHYHRPGNDYTPSPSQDLRFMYHKGFQDCVPCYGQNCFTAPYTPVSEMTTFVEPHYIQNRSVGKETGVQRPTSLPFNGLIRTAAVQQRNNLPNFGHRQLPPLPVNSKFKEIPLDINHYTVPPTLNSGPHHYIASKNMANEYASKEDHRICFDTESVLDKSTSLIEGSYFEDNVINGNYYGESKAMTLYSQDDSSGISSCCTGSEHQNSTHRVHSPFIPRHDDEVLLEVGDAVHVEREYHDHWCYGTNLRTGQQGIFPVAHVCEIDFPYDNYSGLPSSNLNPAPSERDTFYLTMLASIEVAHHKGNDVLIQAMNKVLSLYKNKEEFVVPVTVVMEISFRGIHIIDKSKRNIFQCPNFDFFYSLQNISFCGAHPKQLRYFGFITKHPILPRFACHVFLSSKSTQVIVEAIGKAFKRSYDEYMAFAHPTEDIYLE